MKNLIYTMFTIVLVGITMQSCTPEALTESVKEQACCGDGNNIPPPPPPCVGEDCD